MWLRKSWLSALLSAILCNQRGDTFIHWPRSEPSPCTKLPQYIYSKAMTNKPLHSHLASTSRWAREDWLGRQHLSPEPGQPERVHEFCSSDRAAGCKQTWWDSAGCYWMLWSATGCSRTWWSTRCALVPQMPLWALQATGRDRMSPCRGSCHHPCVNSWCIAESPVQVQRSWAHRPVWVCPVYTYQVYSLIQKAEGFAGRPLRWMHSCLRHISHLTEKGTATWHLILAPSMAVSCICRPEQIASRPM